MPPSHDLLGENQAGLLLLVGVAAGLAEGLDGDVARTLDAIGWVHVDDSPLTSRDGSVAARETRTMLQRLGAVTERRYREQERPTPEGVTLARAALVRWPAGR